MADVKIVKHNDTERLEGIVKYGLSISAWKDEPYRALSMPMSRYLSPSFDDFRDAVDWALTWIKFPDQRDDLDWKMVLMERKEEEADRG